MLYSYAQCSVHPHILVTSSQGLVCRPMRGQDLSGRLYAEHRSCREVTPLGNLHVNAICMGGIQWTREVSIISSIEQASCMGVGEHYRCFEAGPSSMDPLSCSELHLFLIQCRSLHNISSRSDFGFKIGETFIIENRIPAFNNTESLRLRVTVIEGELLTRSDPQIIYAINPLSYATLLLNYVTQPPLNYATPLPLSNSTLHFYSYATSALLATPHPYLNSIYDNLRG